MEVEDPISILIQKYEDGMSHDFDELLNSNLTKACNILGILPEQIFELKTVKALNEGLTESKKSIRWKYVSLGFHLLFSIDKTNADSKPVLSVKQTKNVRTILQLIVSIGLVPNLIPGIGINWKSRSAYAGNVKREPVSVFEKYRRLRSVTNGLLKCIENFELRKSIVPYHLGDLLAALLQLSFAPLKKPGDGSGSNSEMTKELYQSLMYDKAIFTESFYSILEKIYQPMIVKELMVLLGVKNPPPPRWLKTIITRRLCELIMEKDGISSLVMAVLDSDKIDTGEQWQQLDVIVSLIVNIGKQGIIEEYFFRISEQIVRLLTIIGNEAAKGDIYIVVSRLLMASLIRYNSEIFKTNIFDIIITALHKCSENNAPEAIVVNNEDLNKCINIIHSCFVVELNSASELPINVLVPYSRIFYRIYEQIYSSSNSLHDKIKEILEKILNNSDEEAFIRILDSVLFDNESSDILKFNEYLEINQNDEKEYFFIKGTGGIRMKHSVETTSTSFINFLELCKNKFDYRVFTMLIKYLGNVCLKLESDRDCDKALLEIEEIPINIIDPFNEKKYIIFKLLEHLFEKGNVTKMLKEKPLDLIEIIKNILKLFIGVDTDKNIDYEPLFVVMMIFEILLQCESLEKEIVTELHSTLGLIEQILIETQNDELKSLLESCVGKIKKKKPSNKSTKEKVEKSKFQKALDDICDPLLPIRAHGLMTLTQLVESKDPEAWARKQYVMCIFKENLRNDDSFIYLSAINGLAAFANVHTDAVIEVLTEEFVDWKEKPESEDENQRIRMNIGEVLVRVTKGLGEMAPKYKSVLINAFLCGVKDPDHLIRTSSLSNLGELCHILGYKLGTMITEVLYCINAVIESDPSIEAKRAAVLVIRKLFTGLGAETIVFLKDSIISIYRTLKRLYMTVDDDIMRLQVQLALEELDSVTKELVLTNKPLEMKIRVLNIKDCDTL